MNVAEDESYGCVAKWVLTDHWRMLAYFKGVTSGLPENGYIYVSLVDAYLLVGQTCEISLVNWVV